MASFNTREEALTACFHALDADKSGYIDLTELRAFVGTVTPAKNLEEAKEVLSWLDADGDHKVTLNEYLSAMEMMTTMMTDEEFDEAVKPVLQHNTEALFAQGPIYHHPPCSRSYLESHVVPVLRQGLLELAEVMEADRLRCAAGVDWEDGQYLPHGWKPFVAMRWLGEYILAHKPKGRGAGPAHHVQVSAEHKPWGQLTRDDKIGMAFRHLDRDNSGYLDVSELLSVAGRLRRDQDLESARSLLSSMDVDQDGRVDLQEYTELLEQLTLGLSEEEFDQGIREVLDSSHLSYCTTREDKFRFLFRQLDVAKRGELTLQDITALAQRIDPEAPPETVAATLAFLDKDHSSQVSEAEFLAAMERVLAGVTDLERLDQIIIRMLETAPGKGLSSAASHVQVDPIDDVEPDKLRELARGLPTFDLVQQLGCTELMDRIASQLPTVLVDVRSPEEVVVGTIPGAINVPALADANAPHGYSAQGDLSLLKSRVAAVSDMDGFLVVAFCNTGLRGGAMALGLSDMLDVDVLNLCGGVINYYNQGGKIKDASGAEVQALHPGDIKLKGYVTRPNKFKIAPPPSPPTQPVAVPPAPVAKQRG